MGRLRTAATAALTNQGISLLAALVSFIVAPLYVHYLGLTEMGLLAIAQAIAGYLGLANGGLNSSTMILVAHAHGRSDWRAIAGAFRHGFVLALGAAALVVILTGLLVIGLSQPFVHATLRLHAEGSALLLLAAGSQTASAIVIGTFYMLLAGLQLTREAILLQGVARLLGQIGGAVCAMVYGSAYSIIFCGTAVNVLFGTWAVLYARSVARPAFAAVPWSREQLVVNLRTGAKSFGLQIGATVSSSAPVLSINHVGYSAAVPTLTLPLQLINLPNTLIVSFAHLMQPAFGEAWSSGDKNWIRVTVVEFMEKISLLVLVAAAGFLAVGSTFVKAWVGLDISLAMVASAVIISTTQTLTAWWKGLLSGVNRHRKAAISELVNGALALLLTWVVCGTNIDAVGLGVLIAGALTSYRILPAEIRRHLEIPKLLPGWPRLLSMLAVSVAVYLSAHAVVLLCAPSTRLTSFATVAVAVAIGGLVFLGLASALSLLDLRALLARWRRGR